MTDCTLIFPTPAPEMPSPVNDHKAGMPLQIPMVHGTTMPTHVRNLELLLKEIRLHKYYGQLKDFRMEQIMGMTDEDLANLGLTEGARRKLKIHLDAVQNPAYRKGPMNGLHVDIPIHQATAVVTGPMPVMPPPSPIQTPPPNYPPTVQPMPHQNLLHMQSLPSNTDEYPPRQVANAWRNPPHNRRASLHHPSQQRPPPPPPPPPPFCHVETQHRSHWTHRQPHMGRMDKGFPPNRPYAIPIVPNAVPQMGHGSDQSPVPPLQSPLDGRIIPTVNATAVIATTQVENRTQGNSLRPNVSSFQPQLMSPQAENFPHTTLTLPSTITTVSVATTGFTMFPPQGKCAVIPPSANEIVTIGKGTVTFVSTTTSPNPETHLCSTKALTNPTQTVAQTVPSKGESKEASSKTEESSEGSAKGTTTVTYANPTLQNAVNMTRCSNCGCSGNCGSSSGSNYTFNYPGYLHPNNMNSPFPFHFGHYFPNLGGNGLIGIPPPSNIPSYASFPHIPPLQFPNGLNPANMYNFQGSYGHLPPNYMHPGLMLQGGQGMFPMGGMGKGKGSQTCYNCGATGHTARECKDSTMEQMSAQGMFRLKYQPPEPLDTTD
ncbi:Zinc finger CCHC domain-containing protein 14 [Branchiostoma belcheri]|nr:Zinc finger CCHC domain-containing protein 14 [Branchiostoma belcheri]